MTEVHRDSLLARQYFVGVAGLATMRRILSRPSEDAARMDDTYPESAIIANPAYAVLPDAVRQAYSGVPFIVIWRFAVPGV